MDSPADLWHDPQGPERPSAEFPTAQDCVDLIHEFYAEAADKLWRNTAESVMILDDEDDFSYRGPDYPVL